MEQQFRQNCLSDLGFTFGMYLVIVKEMVSRKYVISTCFHLSKMQDGYIFY